MAAAAATALAAVLLLLVLATTVEAACSVSAIYSFGDSIADTGNLLREGPAVGAFASIGTYPYGQTLRRPTGRCSDGLLIIDYFGIRTQLAAAIAAGEVYVCGKFYGTNQVYVLFVSWQPWR